jgi:hypothetical protein
MTGPNRPPGTGLSRRADRGSGSLINREVSDLEQPLPASGAGRLRTHRTAQVGPLLGLAIVSVSETTTFGTGPAEWIAFSVMGLFLLSSLYFWLHFGKPGGFGIRSSDGNQGLAST